MTSIRKTAVQTAGRALLVVAQLMAIVAGVVQPVLPASIVSLQPLVGAPQMAFAAGEVLRVTKVVTTTDGSALPVVSGNFPLAINCVGASGFPTTTLVPAGGATNFTTVTSGTLCLASEDGVNLPNPPSGYTWAWWTVSTPVTVTSNQTRTLTVTNFLAPTFATATSVLTVTKTVNGAAQHGRIYTMTVTGPNSYSNTFTLTETAQLSRVLTGLTPGIYTVTEQSPDIGWNTGYTVTSGNGITSSTNAVMTMSGIITATPFSVASITGTVYSDFNADGMMNSNGLLTDTGVASVTVKAFALNGTTLGPVQTDASGRYTITTSGTQGPFRLEFTNLPADFEPSRVFTGTENGTSVQFVNTPAQAASANFAIAVPCETCLNSNPLFAATRAVQVSAVPSAAELAISSIRDFPYTAGTTNPNGDVNTDNPSTFTLAVPTSATGNVGAMSYDNANRRMYLASYFKRHTLFGPGGLNAIYLLNAANNTIVQTITVPGPATNWHDTTNYYNDYRISGTTGLTNTFDAAGKSSLGGLELSLDGQHLFVINLENRTLYKIHITTGVAVGSAPVSLAGCSNNDARPYALKMYRGKIYLGVTCTAETSQNAADLKALVYTVDPDSLALSGAPVFSANLNYARSFAIYIDANGAVPAKFNPWTNVYRRATSVNPINQNDFWVSYPQPYLTDLDFDNGNLILALRDRYSDQTGNNRPISGTASALISAIAAGDLLRACGNPLTGWTLESNRTCGGVTASVTTPVSPTQGPGGLEYYADGYNVNRVDPDHDENATGSIFQLAGSPLLMSVVYDPLPNGGTFDGGVAWFNNATGQWVRGFRTIDGDLGGNTFGKSSGMGDTSALCNPPPLEIGNRVWDDVNGNGVQDPGEPGLSGVNVTLSWSGGSVATTSNIDGNYYFTREAATGAFSQTLQQYKTYTITFSTPAGYSLTVPNAQAISGSPSSNDSISDTRDSDAVLIDNVATILYTTGAFGENNHGLDAGFARPVAGSVNVTNTPPPPPQIKVVKYTNGFDADTGTGPFIGVGKPVTWTYAFTNTGAVSLTNLILNDTPAGAVTSCTPSLSGLQLAPGGRVTCTLSSTAVAGVYSNTVVVTGTSLLTGQPATDTNPSRYFGAQPAIVLRKYTNGYDADTLADPRPLLVPNALVTWTYVVTNTGNMTLTLALTDDRISTAGAFCAPVALGGQLGAGRVTTCTLPGTAQVAQTVAGIYSNTAVVTGTPVLPPDIPITPDIPFTPTLPVTAPVTSTNPSHYEIYPQFGDRVWLESDGDGNVNTGFIGPVAGMVITATNGVVTFTTTTDASGYYSFTLPAGTYTVTYGAVPPVYGTVLPSATPTGNSASGNAGAYQGGNDLSRPQNSTVTLSAGQANWTMDFAFTAQKFDVGNHVWADTNNNSTMDSGEVGIANVVVWLQTPTTTLTTLTDASGYYVFANLPAGVYTPVIAAVNFQSAGALRDYVSSYGATTTYTTTDNGRDHGIDPATLAAYLLNGVSGTPLAIGPGIQPVGEDPTAPTTPNGDGNNNLTLDFGFYKLSLGNQVWEDNGAGGGVLNNGLRDGTEPGIAGVTVTLYANNAVISTTVTDANGIYGFTNLLSGTYSITVQLPAGYVSSKDPVSGGNPDNQVDDDDNGIGTAGGAVSSAVFNLTPGAELNVNNSAGATSDPTIDFGAWKPSAIGDYVWYDLNHDGVQNNSPGESGVSGVTVTLYLAGAPISTTFTDATGFYVFTNLVPGTYSVTFQLPGTLTFTVPSATTPDASDTDSDAKIIDGQTGSTDTFNLGYAEYQPRIDAGVWRPAGLGDTIWIDTNGNGVQEPGEPGVPGVTATLYIYSPTVNGFVQLSQTVTGNGGYYEFTNLMSGTYQVMFSTPAGYTWTIPNVGSPISDSNVITPAMGGTPPFGGGTLPVVLTENEFNPTIDGGLVPLLVNLGNQVWFDTNDNGLRDAGEVGIPGVRVELYRDSDNSGGYTPGGDAFVDARVTDAGGTYTFTDLAEGRYVLVIAGANFSAGNVLAGYRSSTTTELDANANVDDNDNGIEAGVVGTQPAYVASSAIDLKVGEEPSQRILPGDSNWTVDFGFFRLWLGGTIWLDVNFDGYLNDGTFAPGNPFVPAGVNTLEPGMPNIPVDLLDPQGNVLAQTTTDASGVFTFTGLTSGSYGIHITAPDGKRSTMDVGTTTDPNNDVDNDDNGIGMNFVNISTGLLTIVPGAEPVVDNNTATSGNPTLDFGLVTGPMLIIRKVNSSQGYVRPDDLITYTLVVTNIGVTLARNVVVTDNVPANTTFVSASGVPAVPIQNGPPVVWQVGNMPPGAVFVGNFVVRVFSQNLNSNLIVNAGTLIYEESPTQTVSVPTNEVVNPLAPTAVTLASFSAQLDAGGVKVTWQTALEHNTFAYNVLRSVTGRREDAVQVNASPLPAFGPSTYSFVDTQGGVGNSYWIEEIELDGARNEYGPTTAQAALPAVSQLQPVQAVAAPPAAQAPIVDAAAGVVGGGVPVVQRQEPVVQNQEFGAMSQETPAQAAVQHPASAVVIEPVIQSQETSAESQAIVAQPAEQPSSAEVNTQQTQPAAQVQQPQTMEQLPLPPVEQVVVGVQTGVNVARSGQPSAARLPASATSTTPAVEPAQSAQPFNPLLPAGAGVLALLGIGTAGVFITRRRKRDSTAKRA